MFACTIAGPSVAEAGRRRSRLVFRIEVTEVEERAAAGGFQSLMPEAVGVPEDADRGAEALLRMRLLAQDDLDQRRCLRPDLICSALDALRRPVGIAPVARWHVLAHGRMLAVR